MIRDVLVASINRGQLPQATAAIVVIVIVVKMPSDDVSKLASSAISKLVDGSLAGWAIAALAIIGWAWHARRQRRWWNTEMDRVSRERTKYQKIALKEKLGSSK